MTETFLQALLFLVCYIGLIVFWCSSGKDDG